MLNSNQRKKKTIEKITDEDFISISEASQQDGFTGLAFTIRLLTDKINEIIERLNNDK